MRLIFIFLSLALCASCLNEKEPGRELADATPFIGCYQWENDQLVKVERKSLRFAPSARKYDVKFLKDKWGPFMTVFPAFKIEYLNGNYNVSSSIGLGNIVRFKDDGVKSHLIFRLSNGRAIPALKVHCDKV